MTESNKESENSRGVSETLDREVKFRVPSGVFNKLQLEAETFGVSGKNGKPSANMMARKLCMEKLGYV